MLAKLFILRSTCITELLFYLEQLAIVENLAIVLPLKIFIHLWEISNSGIFLSLNNYILRKYSYMNSISLKTFRTQEHFFLWRCSYSRKKLSPRNLCHTQKYFYLKSIFKLREYSYIISQEVFMWYLRNTSIWILSFSGISSLKIFILMGTSTAEVLHNLENIYLFLEILLSLRVFILRNH